MDLMRWHFTISQSLYNKSLVSYVDAYLSTTLRKQRSILKHCMGIGFDYTQYVDSCFRHFLTDFLPFGTLLDVLLIFISEGIKSLFRFTYAICKVNKDFIKTITEPSEFIQRLSLHSKHKLAGADGELKRMAFKYKLGAAKKYQLS